MPEKQNSSKKSAPAAGNGSQSPAALENRLQALTVLSNSILREVESLKKTETRAMSGEIDFYQEVHRFEIDLIRCALLRTGGKQRRAARLLNIKVTTLNAKIKRYGLAPNSVYRESELEIPE